MRFNLKAIVVVVIAILLSSTGYYIYFITETNDIEAPKIDTVTGNIFAKQGEYVDISVNFSDNEDIMSAIIFYKTEDSDTWSNSSILSGTYNIYIPRNSPKDWYYYIVIDDKAGNGPIGDPSTDGSLYYIIEVADEGGNGDDKDFIHTVFIEEGTATDCQYCPYTADKLKKLYESGEYRFYYVNMIEDRSDKAKTRLRDDFNLYGNPTVFIDGGYKVIIGGLKQKSDYINAIREAESRSVPKIKLNITSEYNNNTGKILTNVLINNYEENDYDGRLRVYLTEKISRWNDYNGSRYHFGFLDYITNKVVSIGKNSEEDFSDSYDASDLDPANLMIIAVIFSSESHQGYANPENEGNPFDAYYADACDATEVVKGGNLPPEVGITFPQQGQVYLRGHPAFKILTSGINLLRNTSTLKYTFLFGVTTIVAYAEDDSSVEKVEFYLNGELIFNDTEEPYEFGPQKIFFKKPLIIPKKYEIMVKAIDDEGKSSSATIEVFAWRAFVY